MVAHFADCVFGKKIISDKDHFIKFMSEEFKKYKYEYIEKPENEYEIDKILGKQIMIHLGEFFNKSIKNKTRRSISNKKNKTQRNY